MGCYWGCGTTGNKTTWGFIIAFGIIGLVLLCAGAIGGTLGGSTNCFVVFTDCTSVRGSSMDARDYCATYAQGVCQFKLWVSLLAAGLGCIVLGCTLPMIYFACSDNPEEPGDEETVPVATPKVALGGTRSLPAYMSMSMMSSRDFRIPENPNGQLMPHPPSSPPPMDSIVGK